MQDTDMIGQTISHYQILEKLGEGGMGVVYKAEDTRLKRTVALKFLPPHLSASEQDKARFSQEAQAASAINHPNICTIHDIQDHDGSMFIVMEFVEGQTLRDLAGANRDSPLPMKRVIEIGIQVADGLAAAHEKGIVHRDVKPENVMVRKDGIVQIMDFGLAKLRGVSRLTREGSTVGTAGYMSPEQVQGQDADHRSDIFSLGVLLYEMFTGQLPFKGVHETALMYEIVNVDATPMVAARPEIDPALDAIVLECLEKDPNERTQSVKQVSIDLKRFRRESGRQRASRITRAIPAMKANDGLEALTGQKEDRRKMPRHRIGLAASVVLAVVAAVLGFSISHLLSPEKETLPIVRASLEMPPGVSYWDGVGGHCAISPDGSRVVFAALDSLSQNRLWLLQLKSGVSHPLTGTDNATYPFWSPDSRFIGFFAEGKVKTIEADGGPTLVLANAPFGRGGAWSPGGEIVFSPSVSDRNLYAVSASGGAARVVTRLDSTANIAPRFPFFLPGGNQYLFSVIDLGPQNSARIHVGSFDNVESKALLEGVSYAGFASGYLFYLRQGVLMAQPFDPGSLSFNGAPLQVQGNINAWPARAKADYSVSSNGVLVYSAGMGGREKDFFWTTTDGVETPVFRSETFTTAVLSPHATHIAYDAIDEQGRKVVIWVYEISGKRKMRLTFTEKSVSRPVWSRDGLRLYFHIEVDASKANIGFKRSDGSGNEEIIARGDAGESVGYYPSDVSSDGRFLLLHLSNESSSELAVIDLTEKEKILPVRKLGIRGREGQFSPDGKWIVYESNESGVDQVYVSSSSGKGGKWQISSEGGTGPLWLRNEIIYYAPGLSRHERVTAAYSSGTPVFGKPQTVFPPGKDANTFVRGMSEDRKRYFAFRPVAGGSTKRLSMIVNWQGLVKQN